MNNVFIYKRSSPKEEEKDIYVALNMVPQPLEGYKIPVYEKGIYKIVLNTDDMMFGGSGYPTDTDMNGCVVAVDEPYNGFPYHIKINLPPLAGIYFMKVGDPKVKKPAAKKTAAKKTTAGKKTTAAKKPAKKPAKKTTTKTKTTKK